jgi:murein DD-endopeptidase MepM/ murein hydrolase activator NlpD
MQGQRHAILGAALSMLAVLALPAGADEAPRFDLPVACPASTGCVVRQYVDQDPGPGYRDYRCGRYSYDGHRGTDIRVPDDILLSKGVAVLAAAPGVVAATRDGVADVSIREGGKEAIKDRAAGNVVLVDHGSGWRTSYWHLRNGSVAVKKGDRVVAGQPIGQIGLSGDTEFVHLHFEIRHDNEPVDPFNGTAIGSGCDKPGQSLWSADAASRLAYVETWLFGAGFAATQPDMGVEHAGGYAFETLPTNSTALVFWIDVIGRRADDRQVIRLLSPDGTPVVEKAETVSESPLQSFQYIGKKRPPAGWPSGRYRGEYRLTRIVDGQPKVVVDIAREIELR